MHEEQRKRGGCLVRRIKRRSLLSRLLLTHAKSESGLPCSYPDRPAASSERRQFFSRSSPASLGPVRFPRYSGLYIAGLLRAIPSARRVFAFPFSRCV